MSKELRNALGKYATGVAIIMTHHDRQNWGLTCNSFASVSLNPPLLLWSIQKNIFSYKAYTESNNFTVSVLSQAESDLALKFAKGTQEERFQNVELIIDPETQIPRLKNCLVWFSCKTENKIPAGDHDIIVGNVQSFASDENSDDSSKSLIFFNGQFGNFIAL